MVECIPNLAGHPGYLERRPHPGDRSGFGFFDGKTIENPAPIYAVGAGLCSPAFGDGKGLGGSHRQSGYQGSGRLEEVAQLLRAHRVSAAFAPAAPATAAHATATAHSTDPGDAPASASTAATTATFDSPLPDMGPPSDPVRHAGAGLRNRVAASKSKR